MNTLCKYCSFWLLSAALLLSAGGNDVPRAQSSPESPERLYPVKEMTPGYTGKFTWGLFGSSRPLKEFPQLQALLPGMDAEHKVTLIRHITPGGIGAKEGLVPGDIVIETSDYSSVTSRPGDPVKLKVWRQRDNKVSDLKTQLPQYHQIKFQPYVKPSGAAEFEKELPPDWEIYAPFLQKEPLKSNFDDLRQRLTDIDSLTDAYRLPVFRYLIRNPFRLEQVSRRWADRMSAAGDWPELLPLGRYMLEFSDSAAPSSAAAWQQSHPRPGADASVEEITAYYLEVLRRCRELHQHAWAKISDEEVAFVRSHRHQAFESICRYHMLSYEPDAASAARTLKIFEILNRIDQRALFEQAETAALLRDESLLARLKSLLANRTGRLHQAQSDCGPVLIYGFGNDYHTGDAALLIDLGGDDIYLNNQATPRPGRFNTSVFIDCGGNDYYSSTDSTGQGCGDTGVGMLLDLAGDDTYTGIEMVQGSAFGGIGILYDRSGNDTYRAIRMSQATAFFGAGMIIDESGSDNYTLQHFGQALGSVRGLGMLLDGSGNDLYICKGNQQTTYNTRGHFDGWGQGTGFGVRPFASGGIGMLIDKSGQDRYDGGTFTQGGGYYYSYGIFCDQGQDADSYLGTRYSQGFAAHQALGAFIEKGGDDIYRTLHAVSLGISWDECVVLFADDNGNDEYDPGTTHCSYSAAHQNGICFFFDRQGNDKYGRYIPIPKSTNQYHLGSSLGIFIDTGSGNDEYVSRTNNSSATEEGDHIFVDR